MSQTVMVMILQYVRSYTWCNQSCFTRNHVDQHVENENLMIRNFPWKTTFLDVIITIHGLEFNDFVNLASPWMMLEQNKKVTNIWEFNSTNLS